MANRKIEVKCKTKLNKDDTAPVESVLTIEIDDEGAADKFMARSVAIAWQSLCRAAGVIPEADTVKVSDMAKRQGGGFKATPASIANRVTKMSIEDYRATLAALKLDAKTIERMVKAHSAK